MKCKDKECGWVSFSGQVTEAEQNIEVNVEEPDEVTDTASVGITITVTLSCPECSEDLGLTFDGEMIAEVEMNEL